MNIKFDGGRVQRRRHDEARPEGEALEGRRRDGRVRRSARG